MGALEDRYATQQLLDIFDKENKISYERQFWISVMMSQQELGVNIPDEDIAKFHEAMDDIDLDRIDEIEKVTRHDIKAKIEAFIEVAQAGEYIHLCLTSRDLTDQIEQMQIKKAAKVIFGKYVSVLRHMTDNAEQYRAVQICARTHHQPAQLTTMGRRFAMWAEELSIHLRGFERFIDEYPLRGIKGPVGTQFDQDTLTSGNALTLEQKVAKHLGFSNVLLATGQVYPRSLDYDFTSQLVKLSSACESFAKTMRLMCGLELATEGFKEGQVGSSAMPHKMNTRTSERICGAAKLVKMYSFGASELVGDQWEEGDVSCSIIRRIIIPDICYATDSVLESTLTVLNEMGVYEEMCRREIERYRPFVSSTNLLTYLRQNDIGREVAHDILKQYSVAEALELRAGKEKNELIQNLAQDERIKKAGITKLDLTTLLAEAPLTGRADAQITAVIDKAYELIDKYPEAAKYEPGAIL